MSSESVKSQSGHFRASDHSSPAVTIRLSRTLYVAWKIMQLGISSSSPARPALGGPSPLKSGRATPGKLFSPGLHPRPCRDCFGSLADESHSRWSVGGRSASSPSTWAQFLVRAVAAEPSREKRRRGDGYRWRRPRRQGCVAGSRAFRAPLQRDRLAVGGQGRGEAKPKAIEPSSCAQTRGADMTGHDPEIEELRDKVHCAVVLERIPPPWKLDRKESTKLSLKYRRGKGEILIVSHAGRGWWDPTSDAKGDVHAIRSAKCHASKRPSSPRTSRARQR
jgi:hypothetical protein